MRSYLDFGDEEELRASCSGVDHQNNSFLSKPLQFQSKINVTKRNKVFLKTEDNERK